MPIISGAVSWLCYQRNSFQFGNIIKYPIGLPQRLCLRSGAVSNREEIRRNTQAKTSSKNPTGPGEHIELGKLTAESRLPMANFPQTVLHIFPKPHQIRVYWRRGRLLRVAQR